MVDWKTETAKIWSAELNVEEEKLMTQLQDEYERIKILKPNAGEEKWQKSAKMIVKAQYKKRFFSAALSFEGIVLGFGSPRDLWSKKRDDAFKKYNDALKLGGDAVEILIADKVIKMDVDERGKPKPVPLCPSLTSGGVPSKIAGQDMPSPQDSAMQEVIGIASVAGKDVPKGFVLQLQGPKACNLNIPTGVPVAFRAINKTKEGDPYMMLSSNETDFIDAKSEKLSMAIEKLGIPKLVEKFFGNNIVSHSSLVEWEESGQVAEQYKELLIIRETQAIYINRAANKKGRVTMNVDDPESSISANTAILCKPDDCLPMNFAENSIIMVGGRPWMAPPNAEVEGDTHHLVLFTTMAIPYAEWLIPLADVDDVSEGDVLPQLKKPEPKPVAAKSDVMPIAQKKLPFEKDGEEESEGTSEDPWS